MMISDGSGIQAHQKGNDSFAHGRFQYIGPWQTGVGRIGFRLAMPRLAAEIRQLAIPPGCPICTVPHPFRVFCGRVGDRYEFVSGRIGNLIPTLLR
jgi:hypothetical protein